MGIMAKVPRSGEVKTRLVPPLSHQQASRLSECFIQDVGAAIARAARARPEIHGFAVYAPEGAAQGLAGLLPEDFGLVPQRGSDPRRATAERHRGPARFRISLGVPRQLGQPHASAGAAGRGGAGAAGSRRSPGPRSRRRRWLLPHRAQASPPARLRGHRLEHLDRAAARPSSGRARSRSRSRSCPSGTTWTTCTRCGSSGASCSRPRHEADGGAATRTLLESLLAVVDLLE